jgi:hypothetical protein
MWENVVERSLGGFADGLGASLTDLLMAKC